MKRYEPVEHTADIGIKVYGKDLPELFSNAAFGMFDNIAELKFFKPTKKIDVTLKESNINELLVSWLRELLYKYIFNGLIVVETKISKLKDNKIRAEISCAEIKDKSKIKKDIKAVTYHGLEVKQNKSGYEVQVIFDV